VTVLLLCLAGPLVASAATSPSLGAADTYSILSGTQVTNSGATTITGDVGIDPAGGGGTTGFPPGIVGPPGAIHNADTAAHNAQVAQKAVFDTDLAVGAQPCTTTYVPLDTELGGLTLDPGVYCSPRDFTLSGTLTLHGTGSPSTDVWIFRAERNLIGSGSANVVFSGTGGLACNVWWRIATTATFTSGNAMVGNILAATSVTFGTGATLNGRAFAYAAEVTLLGNTVSGPTCTVTPTPTPTPSTTLQNYNTITVVKQIINDNGGTATYTDFPLFVNGNPVSSGESLAFMPGTYTVTETNLPNYQATFSGDCNVNGQITHGGINTHNDVCVITNNDIGAPVAVPPVPPLIDVVKVPNPLALPAGPGTVTYGYTLRNVGTVPVTNVTLVGDTCSPITLVSGDTNGDSKLDVTETWKYTCSTTLSATHTNTVVATGWANGLSATDIASATVVVGAPTVPPLIHVTKIPSPLTLPAGGGSVTYTERITNPGTVALSNVTLTDDKCGPMQYASGDTNGDSKLDVSETWTYTCRTNLTQTTLNTAVATGEANGLTVRDLAIATVVVATAAPALPNTGFGPALGANAWILAAAVTLALMTILLVLTQKKRLS